MSSPDAPRSVAAAQTGAGQAGAPGVARGADQLALPNLAVTLALLSTLGPYSMDAFFPSLRAMAAAFDISYWQVQQAVTAYMLPYACMSLVHGSVSDALGRRRVILIGLSIYVCAACGCMLAPAFGWLLLFRFLQGAVAGTGHIVGRAIIRDRYEGAQAQRLMSTITMVFSLGPALAPIIGGWVHTLFGWRMVFGTMALYGVALWIMVWRRLPETHTADKRVPFQPRALLANIVSVFRHREFMLLTASSGFCMIALHLYVGSAPAIILDHWHLGETSFAALTLPIICGYTIGAYISGKLAGRFPPERQARLGFTSLLVLTAAMLVLQLSFDEAPIVLQQLLLVATAIGLQLMFPIVTLRILDLFTTARGAAASVHSFFSLFLATLTMGGFAPWLGQSMVRLATTAFLVNLTGWLLWRRTERYRVAQPA
ncbi:MAG: multidrug effflux MFS transporter [Steroidobacteraceae bacterium]